LGAAGGIFQPAAKTATMPLHPFRCSGATLGEIHLCNLATIVLRMAAVIAVLAMA